MTSPVAATSSAHDAVVPALPVPVPVPAIAVAPSARASSTPRLQATPVSSIPLPSYEPRTRTNDVPVAAAPTTVATSASDAPSTGPASPSVLFAEATEARRTGNTGAALAAYKRLDAAHPRSREAILAHAIVGRLLLDRGDAETAIVEFDAYLRANREELREQTMASRASAFERLGRRDQEASAWHALLADYPSSAYRSHASSRLASLGGP
ncbi:MAG: tetratricopeptide repeat protein [Polyangiaceae bacterium]